VDDKAYVVTFAQTLDPEVLRFGETKPPAAICPWCGQPLPAADLDACPHCQALLKPADAALEVPGVTTLSQDALRILEIAEAKKRRKARGRFRTVADEPIMPIVPVSPDADEEIAAIQPPDAEVRRVMRQLEYEAALAAAGLAAPDGASEASSAASEVLPEPAPGSASAAEPPSS
jgi:hypothetical protein